MSGAFSNNFPSAFPGGVNNSASGGYLVPLVVTPPTEDADLDAQLQAIVVGITGINGTLVRPRWQPVDPKQPDRTVSWCAIGVTNITPDAGPAIIHRSFADINDPATNDEMQRHEVLEILASFYGPSAATNAATLMHGLTISQNREAMTAEGMGLIEVLRWTRAPELVGQSWINRIDLPFTIRRITVRNYPVLNIVSAAGTIVADQGSVAGEQTSTTPFSVQQP